MIYNIDHISEILPWKPIRIFKGKLKMYTLNTMKMLQRKIWIKFAIELKVTDEDTWLIAIFLR